MEIHIVGGFQDDQGQSEEITDHILNLLSDLSIEYKDNLTMELSTCIIHSLNDDKHMGINLSSSDKGSVLSR